MNFDWSTFILEIVNFLILVWILKRFLYQPVRKAIEARREAIDKDISDAQARHQEADELKQRYENRLRDWEAEREKARAHLEAELDGERDKRLQALELEIKGREERAHVLAEREVRLREQAERERAQARAGEFVRRLLASLAGPELQSRLIERLLDGMQALPADRLAAGHQAWSSGDETPVVTTAFPLDGAARKALLDQLVGSLGKPGVPPQFEEDKALVAGIRLEFGSWLLSMNLRDEMDLYRDTEHEHAT